VNDAEILDGIREVARKHLGWTGPLRPQERLVEDLELDSLKLLTLAVEVENRFRVCLEEGTEARIQTVADLVGALREAMEESDDVRPAP
jgi:acyl carrier protein